MGSEALEAGLCSLDGGLKKAEDPKQHYKAGGGRGNWCPQSSWLQDFGLGVSVDWMEEGLSVGPTPIQLSSLGHPSDATRN
jgi:hypothetical protein